LAMPPVAFRPHITHPALWPTFESYWFWAGCQRTIFRI